MKAKKNDIVFLSTQWNAFNNRLVQEVKIQSWGKKQAKASHVYNGEMLDEFIYLNDGECDFAFATFEEAETHGLEILEEHIAAQVAYLSEEITKSNSYIAEGKSVASHLNIIRQHQEKLDDYNENGIYVLTLEEGRARF